MSSIVLELQRDALDREVAVSDLLRKALVVARKLKIEEIQEWITREAGGYHEASDIPEYRKLTGRIRAWNPFSGWIPVIFEDSSEAELFSSRDLGMSIAEVENLAADASGDTRLRMPFPHEIQKRLLAQDNFSESEVALFIQRSGLVRVLDSVRTIILNWGLSLEEQGILGEGLSFSPEEKRQASAQMYNIANFFGTVESPQVQQGTHRSLQVRAELVDPEALRVFLRDLRCRLDDLQLEPETRAEAAAEIETVEAQLQSPKPKAGIVREGLRSLRAIIESAGGGVAGQLLLELGRFLQ